MDVDSAKIYRVLLNHIPPGKKPNKAIVCSLTRYLPDCKILGFGYYEHYKLWYLLVFDPTFPIQLFSGVANLSWEQATNCRGTRINTYFPTPPKDGA